MRDEFLSEEDLDLRNLTESELLAYWELWLHQAQATNALDAHQYSHGVFISAVPASIAASALASQPIGLPAKLPPGAPAAASTRP
jgi:hypothetical protein